MSHENSKELIFKLSWDIFRKLRKHLKPSVCEEIRKEVEEALLTMRDEKEWRGTKFTNKEIGEENCNCEKTPTPEKKPRYTRPGVGNGKTYDSIEEMEKDKGTTACCETCKTIKVEDAVAVPIKMFEWLTPETDFETVANWSEDVRIKINEIITYLNDHAKRCKQ